MPNVFPPKPLVKEVALVHPLTRRFFLSSAQEIVSAFQVSWHDEISAFAAKVYSSCVDDPADDANLEEWCEETDAGFSVAAGVKAELDLGALAAGDLDTIVQAKVAGVDGNAITVEAVGDSPGAGGVTIDEVDGAVTIHFEDGVSTVADVEAAITADSDLIEVKTAGTGATVLDVPADEFAAESLAGGTGGPGSRVVHMGNNGARHLLLEIETADDCNISIHTNGKRS